MKGFDPIFSHSQKQNGKNESVPVNPACSVSLATGHKVSGSTKVSGLQKGSKLKFLECAVSATYSKTEILRAKIGNDATTATTGTDRYENGDDIDFL